MAALVAPVFWQHWRQLIPVAVSGDVIVSTKVTQINTGQFSAPKKCIKQLDLNLTLTFLCTLHADFVE